MNNKKIEKEMKKSKQLMKNLEKVSGGHNIPVDHNIDMSRFTTDMQSKLEGLIGKCETGEISSSYKEELNQIRNRFSDLTVAYLSNENVDESKLITLCGDLQNIFSRMGTNFSF